MGLIDDTLRDARRPLGACRLPPRGESGGREAGAAAPAADEYLTRPRRGSAAAGVCEVREEGQRLSREASFQSGGGERRLPAGDPLSAGMGAERPKSLATNVGLTDVSVEGDRRESKLATGQDHGRSPGKVAAAEVSSVSRTHRSVVLPEPVEAESDHPRQSSTTPEGGTRSVSRPVETFLSRPSGRGAPPGRLTVRAAAIAAESAAPVRAGMGPGGPGRAPGEAGTPDTNQSLVAHRGRVGRYATAAQAAQATQAAQTGDAAASRASSPARAAAFASDSTAVPAATARGGERVESRRRPEIEPPGLYIGRIDVTVLADGAAPADVALPPGDTGFLSRNYLRRL